MTEESKFKLSERPELVETVNLLNTAIDGQIKSSTVLLMRFVSTFQGVLTKRQLSDIEEVSMLIQNIELNQENLIFFLNEDGEITTELIDNIKKLSDEILIAQKVVVKNKKVQNNTITSSTKMGFILIHELLEALSNTFEMGLKPVEFSIDFSKVKVQKGTKKNG